MNIKNLPGIVLATLAASLSGPAVAAEEWEFEVTPYFFAAGLEGTIGVRDVEADVDASFSDISDYLDSAFMGLFTARKDRWTYGFEVVYLKLSNEESSSVTGPLGRVEVDGALEVTTEMYIYQGTVAYNVSESDTRIDLLAAVRYTEIDSELELDTSTNVAIFPGREVSADGSVNWTDLVVGVSVAHPLTDNLDLVGYADIGGNSDDDTYQALLGLNWEFAKDWIAKAGYREMSWDYKKDGTTWDIKSSGPYLGLGYRF